MSDNDDSPTNTPSSVGTLGLPLREVGSRQPKKYVILAVSLLLGLVSGTMYGYGLYSKDLKDTLNLSHFELELLGILLDTGHYISQPLNGHIFDHYGPRVCCTGSALMVFLSYGTVQLILSGALPTSIVALRYCFFVAGFGNALGYSAAVGTTVRNFESTSCRRFAVGVVAAGFALCSTLVGLSYNAFGLDYFFLVWAVVVASVNILCVNVFNSNFDSRTPQERVESIEETQTEEEVMLLAYGEKEQVDAAFSRDYGGDEELVAQSTCTLADSSSSCGLEDPLLVGEVAPSRWVALRSIDFWVLFLAFATRTGCGLFLINNVSTMVQSAGGDSEFARQLVILLSVSNFSGRIFVGSLADRESMNKVTMFALAMAFMAAGLFLSAGTSAEFARVCLVVTVVVVATCYGGSWVLLVGIVTDSFGVDNVGKNLGVIVMGPAFSGMMFNWASAWMYEQQVAMHHHQHDSTDETHICLGTECYRDAFLLTGCSMAVITVLLCCLSLHRTKTRNS